MESTTQTVNRILEALAPTLAAELERIQQDIRQQLEEDFCRQRDILVQNVEQAALQTAQIRQEHAVAGVREETRSQLAELQSQFSSSLQQTTADLKAQFDEQTQAAQAAWTAERSRLEEQLRLWHTLAAAERQLGESLSQAEMLTRFLSLAEPFAAGTAVYVARVDGFVLWKTRGELAFPNLVLPDTIDPQSYFRPIIVRDKTVAAFCARQPCEAEPLDFLVASLTRAIEAAGIKLQMPSARPVPVETRSS